MFEYDYCFCGNADDCPNKNKCKRAKKVKGIHTYSLFYEKNKECKYFWENDDQEVINNAES